MTHAVFQVSYSKTRYGPGVTREIGQDVDTLGAKNVLLVTDKNVGKLPAMKQVLESFANNNINYTVYDDVRVEPTSDRSVNIY